MPTQSDIPRIPLDDFARRFSLRAERLMWFLGAGASASAGVPTATDMIWEFKQELYVSQRRASAISVADLSQPGIRARLQAHINSLESLPHPDTPEEYAGLFEAAYPAESDRQKFFQAKFSGAKPSYGHFVLATLMREGKCRLVWTTNFDTLVDDACAKIFDTTGALTVAGLDTPDVAKQAIDGENWPVEVKLHGDFRSRRLKNTSDELRYQDKQLKKILVESCQRNGLIVIGYSGRDDSVMNALQEAAKNKDAFPAGLFWLHRREEELWPQVYDLLREARNSEIESTIVSVENFDETLRDLIPLIPEIEASDLDGFSTDRRRWSPAPYRQGQKGWPIVRFNALPIVDTPNTCRLVECQIGGTADVREAVRKANVQVIAARSQFGVLAFGTDSDVKAAFGPYGITRFDLHNLEVQRRQYESSERSLLHKALIRAMEKHCGLSLIGDSSRNLAPTDPHAKIWTPLRELVGELNGEIRGCDNLVWKEGIATRLDWADGRLWLLIEPRIVFEGRTDDNKAKATDFARERTVKRYNPQLNKLIDFWAKHMSQNGSMVRAFNIGDGVDAIFRIGPVTGFSWRLVS